MGAGAHRFEEPDQVLDIFIEAEAAVPHADVARIGPVGDVHVVLGQQDAHGIAQQGREMPGKRRHQQHARLRRGTLLGEAEQGAEGGGEYLLLVHRHRFIAHPGLVDAE